MIVENPLKPDVRQKQCMCNICAPRSKELRDENTKETYVAVVQPARLHHWFCCMCQKGPFQYGKRNPYFIKNWYASGTSVGTAHYCCSEPCRVEYLRLLEAPAERDVVGVESVVTSTRDQRPVDSD